MLAGKAELVAARFEYLSLAVSTAALSSEKDVCTLQRVSALARH